MKLSILICSLTSRHTQLVSLLSELYKQQTVDVEIITNVDSGQLSVGAKRNQLLKEAKGLYCAYIDDDDKVSQNYVQKILTAIKANPDCVGMEGIYTKNGMNPIKFVHSLKYKSWFEDSNGILCRSPNHLNPIKTSIARMVGFPEKNFGEDKDFSQRVLPYLKSEIYISGPLYYYQYDENKSATRGR